MLGLDKLNEKAPTMPDVVKFDNIFSNDLEEENEYDLFFGAEEDDQLIEAIAQDDYLTRLVMSASIFLCQKKEKKMSKKKTMMLKI